MNLFAFVTMMVAAVASAPLIFSLGAFNRNMQRGNVGKALATLAVAFFAGVLLIAGIAMLLALALN